MAKESSDTDNVIEEFECGTHQYGDFLNSMKNHFRSIVYKGIPLFKTNTDGLFDIFLSGLPLESRQHYTCTACRHFVKRYGNLAVITEAGDIEPALWGEAPDFFAPSVLAIRNKIINSTISGIFVSSSAVLGKPTTGSWSHMSVEQPDYLVSQSLLKTPYQIAAEKLEDFNILCSALKEYPLNSIEQAVVLLKTESLYRSEKCLGAAEWMKHLHIKIQNTKDDRRKNNLIWLAAATAPIGYCHVKSSMIGTLLDDIVSGLPFESIRRRFEEKMHPLQYQRPQASPTIGNLQQAERIVAKLGIQESLVRRFARLDELETIWRPIEGNRQKTSGAVFSHIVPKENKKNAKMNIPATTMTWAKFSDLVLPSAEKIEFLVKDSKDSFSAMLTAEHLSAPPILQWDKEEKRNPFSLYIYHGGSYCTDWNLSAGYCKVTGICYRPSMWHGSYTHQGKSVLFILSGARDKLYKESGNALFPEILKSELHEIRSSIEAYSKNAITCGYDESSACGILLSAGSNWNSTFRVTTNAGTAVYRLDRWD